MERPSTWTPAAGTYLRLLQTIFENSFIRRPKRLVTLLNLYRRYRNNSIHLSIYLSIYEIQQFRCLSISPDNILTWWGRNNKPISRYRSWRESSWPYRQQALRPSGSCMIPSGCSLHNSFPSADSNESSIRKRKKYMIILLAIMINGSE